MTLTEPNPDIADARVLRATAVRPASRPVWIALAWTAIAGMCVFTALLHRTPSGEPDQEDDLGLTLMQLQARYAVGAADLLPWQDVPALYASLRPVLDAGTVGQRQRAVIVAAYMAGPAQARSQLEKLDLLLSDPPEPVELSETAASIGRVLHRLYPESVAGLEGDEAREALAEAVISLSNADRTILREELGWFGSLALAAGQDSVGEREALLPARVVAIVALVAALAGGAALLSGFVALILLVIFTVDGRLRSGFGPRASYHGVYAETFAVWMALFLGLQLLAPLIAPPGAELLVIFAMFLASLGALGWPVLRGVPWKQVRADLGLTAGRVPWAEPLLGVVAYLATLPLLAAGIALMLVLMFFQGLFAGQPPVFGPTGGPAHPAVAYLSGPDLWPKIQLLLLASVGAPIVEETMFRGVLYRHLRDASRALPQASSVLLGAAASGFIFAAVHPQGFVAIPALMSLGIGMALVREWRGTLVPAMVLHAVSNGLVMSVLLVLLGV